MAYRRSLTTTSSIARRHQYHPSVTHILRDDDRKQDVVSEHASASPILNQFLSQKRFFGNNLSRVSGFGGGFAQDRRISNALLSSTSGFAFSRSMSSASEKVELLSDVSGVLSDTGIEGLTSQVPAMSEVAVAAADSWLPVKGLQYFIEAVHVHTGLNWWAAIAITTILIRNETAIQIRNAFHITGICNLHVLCTDGFLRISENWCTTSLETRFQHAGCDVASVAIPIEKALTNCRRGCATSIVKQQ